MQTILGANGVIAMGIAKALPQYTQTIRLVSRTPRAVNPTDQTMAADLTDPEQTDAAVRGSEVVYLTVGLAYDHRIWQEQWPFIMGNVIRACAKHDAKLVFFDNVYLYGKVDGWMDENTPARPTSKKGELRARIADMLLGEIERGTITGLITRAADFYGKSPLSIAAVLVFDNYAKRKAAQILIDADRRHSYTYIPDAGKATALLGNTPDAFDQVWHLPTDKNALTARAFVEEAARAFGVPPKYTVLRRWMLGMVGLFNPVIKESMEMLYQNEFDYLFSSDKFEAAFEFTPTRYAQGIAEVAASYEREA